MEDFKKIFTDSSRKLADLVVSGIENDPESFEGLYQFTMLQLPQYAMRSSRVVALLAYKNPELIQPYLEKIVHNLDSIKDIAVKRNFMQILKKYYWFENEDTLGILVNSCFSYISLASEPISVRAYSIDILYNISKKIPELKQELASTIEFIMPESSPGIKVLCKKTLKKLNK